MSGHFSELSRREFISKSVAAGTAMYLGLGNDLGLAAALDWQLSQFRERTGLACKLELQMSPYDVGLEEKQSTAFFRVFQELLTNVARHAKAHVVKVTLERDETGWVLTVSDDGRGITEEQMNDPVSLGLIGIRERLRPLHGEVRFSGTPGKGTIVRVSLPAN